MSDNWLQYVPRDPQYQPSREASARAVELLSTFAPRAESIDVEFHDGVQFFHPGQNWSGVKCPVCGTDLESWWSDAMETAAQRNFSDLSCTTPCCNTQTSLDRLHYVWPAAFGRYVLEAMNPNIVSLSTDQLAHLESALGIQLREIPLHI